MTEIHERLQPVAEVGENGSNGDEDSISGDRPVIPLGSSSMTRPLFISQQQGASHQREISEANNIPIYSNQDEDCFHLKRVETSAQGGEHTIIPSSSHIQTSFHTPSTHHNRLPNVAIENSILQPTHKSIGNKKDGNFSKKDFDGQDIADDILEYDEDNVIVIDLDDIRNNPGKESETTAISETMDTPKRRVEIKRQVYYDDSDLFSPPPPDENEEPAEVCSDKLKNTNDLFCVHSSNNGTSDGPRKFSLEDLSKDCDPNADDTIHKITRKDSSTESSSDTTSINSQNDENTSENINHVPLPPPIQSVLDDNDIIQDECYNDNDNDSSQRDIVQPPSPFSERSCSSSATTGASSVKQSHCPGAPSSKSKDINSATASILNETIERKILHPQTSIIMESDQPVFYEASKFERTQIVGLDNHSQLTLSSISSDTVCHQDLPLPKSSESKESKNSQDQNNISHPSSLPPVKVHGRTNLTSAAFNNSHNGREYDNSTTTHKNSIHYENRHHLTSIQSLVNEQHNEYKTHKDSSLPSELQKEKRDRPNQLFPSVPTSSSVIINNNSCGTSPLPSAKCRTTQNKDAKDLISNEDIQIDDVNPSASNNEVNHNMKRKEQRHRMRKKLPSTKQIPFRDVSTPTAHSVDAKAIRHELEREKRSASCRRIKDRKRNDSDSHTNTFNSQHDILNANMSYSSSNTLQRNFGGRSGIDGDDIMRRTYYRGGIIGRKAKSNDFLDQMDNAMTKSCIGSLSGGMSGSVRGGLTSISRSNSGVEKMTKIEKNLYLGSLEAATDAILLEAHNISHIVTVDSIALPQKMTSLLPRIALLYLQVTDLPDEDLLSHFDSSNDFISDCIERQGGSCLVHCFRGRSRSATVVAAYLMLKHGYSATKALAKIRSRRPSINPHESFQAQLKMYEAMDYTIDATNIQLKMFRLHCASEKMRKAKILFRDSLDLVLDEDPVHAGNMAGVISGITGEPDISKSGQRSSANHPVVYKCKRCRRTLATAFNMLPHCIKESPDWTDPKWALPCEEVLEGASDTGLSLCGASVFINPTRWMAGEIKAKLAGRLYCPQCQARVGNYSWVMGRECNSLSGGCGAVVVPAFQLDVTEIIFRTRNKYLQSTGREPVVV